MRTRLIAIAFPAAALLTFALASKAHTNSAIPDVGQNAGGPALLDARTGLHWVPFPDDVGVEVDVSLLAPVIDQRGVGWRPTRINALYLGRTRALVGQRPQHGLLHADSTESVDLSLDGVDIGGVVGPETIRSYGLQVTPVPGKTWGTIDDVKRDLLVTSLAR